MKKWIKISLLLLSVAALSVGIYFTLKALGVTSIEGIREIISKCGALGWIVFIVLFVLASTLLCFIPGTSATFIAVSILLFGTLKGFIISTISVFTASSLMFLIGNTLGEKAAVKLVGKESLEKAQNLLDVKSKMLLPLMFLFPIFPDDALCLVAGMTKMRYWYFAVVVAIFRTIGIGSICFLGSGVIDWSVLSLVDWFVLGSVCAFWLILIFKYQHKIEQFITRKKKPQPKTEITETDVVQYEDRIANLISKRDEYQRAIDRHQKTIDDKKYCSESQLQDIKKKISKIEAIKRKLEKNLERELNKEGIKDSVGQAIEDTSKELREIACREIQRIMKFNFPSVEYSLKQSVSTESVYLTLKNSNGVEQTLRFSNHKSAKMEKRYSLDRVTSVKDMKNIISKNLKILNRKTVYVLLNRLEKQKGQHNE